SSKCCQVESPSPLRFLAALMPPCAHTECERFTGTMEKRSTLAPISAILMTAESPARPPPMTIILGAAISLYRLSVRSGCVAVIYDCAAHGRLLRARPKCGKAGQSRPGQDKEEGQAHNQKALPRSFSGNDAPLRREQPDAVSKVPRRRDQAGNIKQEQRSLKHFRLHLAERSVRICVQVNAGKAHGPGVPNDVKECDAAGPALRRVHPVSGPGIFDGIPVAPVP